MLTNSKAFSSFSVDSIEKAKAFYGQTLGLNVSDNKMQGLDLNLAGGNKIFIYPKPNHVPATFTILNFLVDDVEKAVDDLTQLGIRFEIYDEGDLKTNQKGITISDQGPKMAWFKDPAGNFLSVIEDK